VQAGSVRVDQLGEALAIIKALLAGQTSHAAGAHYTVASADLYPRPVQQPHPPILIAARGKRLLALAVREANIIAIAASPDTGMAAVAETIEWLRTAAGDRFEQLELNRNVIGVGSEIPPWLAARMGLDAARLQQSGVPLEFEHLYPEAYGGLTVRENLWLACTRCNGFRGDRVDAIDRRQVSVCRPSTDARSSGPSTSRGCRTVCESLVLPSSAVRQWRCYA
jgi:hypothetical protein